MDIAILAADSQVVASPLLHKLRQAGLSLPLDLERLAVARGCNYYERDLPLLGESPIANVEVAIALLLPSAKPSAREIRLAAALLAAPDVRASDAASLAVQENCANIVRYIAECGKRFEPENRFWQDLLDFLPNIAVDRVNLPHPTRFVEMTGLERGKIGVETQWIRPRRSVVK